MEMIPMMSILPIGFFFVLLCAIVIPP